MKPADIRWVAGLGLVACGAGDGLAVLEAGQNYAFESTLSVGSQDIAAGQDAQVDWSELSVDQLGKSMNPDEVDQLIIVRFEELTEAQVLEKAAKDCLQQKDITGVVEHFPGTGETRANLSDFQLIGYNVDPAEQFQEGMGTFLLNAYTDGLPGTRMLSFISPNALSESLNVSLLNDSASVDFVVDLSVGERLSIDTLSIDWAKLEVPTDCGSFPINKYDWLMGARYDGKVLADLEADVLRVDELASEVWNADIEGRSTYDLLDLVSEEGNAFTGFDTDSLWLLALRCTTCNNPAPPFLTIVGQN